MGRVASIYQCPVTYTGPTYTKGHNGKLKKAPYHENQADGAYDCSTTQNIYGKNVVTSVKNQGSCGSCWAFSAAAAIEGVKCIAGTYNCNAWQGASAQNFVDCTNCDDVRGVCSYGCNGGWPENAFYYTIQNGGVDSWTSYGYTATDNSCGYNSRNSIGTISTCGGTSAGLFGDEEVILTWSIYENGPNSILFDAGAMDFQFYSGGIYTSNSCTKTTNHAMLAVGYGTTGGQNYFKIKNSWGTSWGSAGYLLAARDRDNQCCVACSNHYPIN